MSAHDRALPEDQSRAVANAVRESIARLGLSRQTLADKARIGVATLEAALAGARPFTMSATLRLENALGLVLLGAAAPGIAPETLGSYSETGTLWIEGRYLTLRPSFGAPGSIFAYETEILWDAAASHLIFREGERLDADFSHAGVVSLPPESGHVYLVTNKQGQYRLAVLGRPTAKGDMYGLLTTLMAGRGPLLTPVASPLVMIRDPARLGSPCFGRVREGDACYAAYRAHLDRVLKDRLATLVDW